MECRNVEHLLESLTSYLKENEGATHVFSTTDRGQTYGLSASGRGMGVEAFWVRRENVEPAYADFAEEKVRDRLARHAMAREGYFGSTECEEHEFESMPELLVAFRKELKEVWSVPGPLPVKAYLDGLMRGLEIDYGQRAVRFVIRSYVVEKARHREDYTKRGPWEAMAKKARERARLFAPKTPVRSRFEREDPL